MRRFADSWGDLTGPLTSEGGGCTAANRKPSLSAGPPRPRHRQLQLARGPRDGPNLIRAILRAPVDLLFNGGISTRKMRVGAMSATAQRPVRVNAKVIGEGGISGDVDRVEFDGRISTTRWTTPPAWTARTQVNIRS